MKNPKLPDRSFCFAFATPRADGLQNKNPFTLFADDDSETIEAKRRRQSGSQGGVSDERAEAPKKRRGEDQDGGGGSDSGGRGGSSTFRLPTMRSVKGRKGGGCLSTLFILAILVIALIVTLFSPSQQPTSDTPVLDTIEPTAASYIPSESGKTIVSPTQAAVTKEGQTWLVMLYQDADDKVLEEDIMLDLNEAERVGSTDRVKVVAQVDRYKSGYTGDGNWTSTRRYLIKKDNNLGKIGSEMVADLGEANMADGNTLVDFVTWAVKTYPADKYVLVLSDHGMGWPGGWSDPAPAVSERSSIPIASQVGNVLYLQEIDAALKTITGKTGIKQFEMIGMDACLMAHLEVFSSLAPYARYAVASQETEPALGWAYTSFLKTLTANPDMDGAQLSRAVVESYIKDDQRIVDDQARAEFTRQGLSWGGLFGGSNDSGAQALADEIERGVTMTAIDLAQLPTLNDSLSSLAFALQNEDQSKVAKVRTYAQSFTSVFGEEIPPSYIDLGNFVQLLKREIPSQAVIQACDAVLAAINQAVIAEKHGTDLPGATGISIYFPNSRLFRSAVTGLESYTAVARRFAEVSLWDDFLAFHYGKKPFEAEISKNTIPSKSTVSRAPGEGKIDISSLNLSSDVAAPGKPVTLSAEIYGNNIGYIYLFVGYYDAPSQSIFVADTDYLESPKTQEIAGVYYPQWSENDSFTLKTQWEPTVFALSDGKKSITTLFTPQQYGISGTETTYAIDGVYTFADGGETREAQLLFRDGIMRQVFSYTGTSSASAPREITPKKGDKFTIYEKWMDLDSKGNVSKTSTEKGSTITFGDQVLKWKEIYAAAGEYVVGLIVSDLDGNTKEAYQRLKVE